MEKPNRLADIEVKGLYEDAEQVGMDQILGMEIIIEGMTLLTSQFGDYAVFVFKKANDPKLYSSACGGYRVVQRMKQAQQEGWYPLAATITKEGKKYIVK